MPETRSLVQELNDLHATYVTAVNEAVADDDLDRADRLAAEYDAEAVRVIAEREGRTDQLPLVRRRTDTPLRRLARRLSAARAA